MRNSAAVGSLLRAARRAEDPLDATACRRAAAWLRWCDGFGAALAPAEAARFGRGGSLGEAARALVRRLSESYPAPPEDGALRYLEEGGAWIHSFGPEPDPPDRRHAPPSGAGTLRP